MKSIYIILTFIIFSNSLAAQNNIAGMVKDEGNAALANVTVSLFNEKDSLIKLEITKNDGSFIFQNIPTGNYFINASHIGFTDVNSAKFILDTNITLSPLVLKRAAAELSSVVVTSKKPLIQVRADRTIVNVEGSINATGNTLLELLRKSPGVTLDKDENISLLGKSGVRIYIDGRPTPLSGADLIAYLQSIQSSSVEAIELITNPSAKYEAAGNAGIINIRLKKNTALGTNGAFNAGLNVGRNARYNSGFNFNHRNAHMNIFGNYNYSGGLSFYEVNIYRKVLDTIFDQQGQQLENSNSHQFKTGIDINLNKNSSLGVSINGNFSTPSVEVNSNMQIIPVATGDVNRILKASNNIDQKRYSAAFNINYALKTNHGKNLVINADHAFYNLRSTQLQPNIYSNATGNTISSVVYRMLSPTNIKINSLSGDYEQDVKEGKLSVGGKWASINSDNDFQRYNVYSTGDELDKDRSNRFQYKEMITAAYVNYNKSWEGIVVQAGLRAEHTTSKGRSTGLKNNGTAYVNYDSSFTKRYIDLFPSAAVTFNKNVMRQWTLSYSRRIDRPVYQELNPFEIKIDEYTSQKGSIDLQPQYTNSVGLTFLHNQKLTASLNYSYVKDMFVQLLDTVEKTKSFVTSRNFGSQNLIHLSLTYPLQYKSYSLVTNATAGYKKLSANFGNGRDIDLHITSFTFLAQNSIKFKETWTAELTGFYNSPAIYGSNLRSKTMWSIDAGIQKQLFNGKANVKLAVSDVFNSLKFEGNSFFAGQETLFSRKAESRQAKISFSWRFGSNTVKAARQNKTGVEDEMKRVQ